MSITIAEAVAGEARTTPWLGRVGYARVGALFILGCVIVTVFSLKSYPFVASVGQFAAGGVLALAAIVVALRWTADPWPPRAERRFRAR